MQQNIIFRIISILLIVIFSWMLTVHTYSRSISDHLADVFVFSELSNIEREILATDGIMRTAKKGEYLIKTGDIIDKLFVVISGETAIYARGHHLVTLEGQQIFGEAHLIDRIPANADVLTTMDSEIIELKIDNFIKAMDSHPELGYKVLSKIAIILSRRIRDMNIKY